MRDIVTINAADAVAVTPAGRDTGEDTGAVESGLPNIGPLGSGEAIIEKDLPASPGLDASGLVYDHFGGGRTDRQRIRRCSAERLWDIVLGRRAENAVRAKSNHVIQKTLEAIGVAGFEDPFEELPEVDAHLEKIRTQCNPATQMEIAFLVFISLRSRNTGWQEAAKRLVKEGVCDEEFLRRACRLRCFLNIQYSEPIDNRGGISRNKLRQIYGGPLLPAHIMRHKGRRVAMCLEYSFLLATILRASGIKAFISTRGLHCYVLAEIGNGHWLMDAATGEFTRLCHFDNRWKPKLDRSGISFHYTHRSKIAMLADDHVRAKAFARFAYDMDKYNSFVLGNLAHVLVNECRYDDALSFLERALLSNELSVSTRELRALIYIFRGQFEDALIDLDVALSVRRNDVKLLLIRADVLGELGQLRRARRDIDHAISLDPHLPDCHSVMAKLYLREGEIEKAMDSCEKALAFDGRHVPAILLLTDLLKIEQYKERAIAILSSLCRGARKKR